MNAYQEAEEYVESLRTGDRNATCADRIGQELADREAQIKAMLEQAEDSEYYGDEEAIYELAIGVSHYKVMNICLSYGGPADYLEVKHDDNGVHSVTYRFSDWFDTATREVEEGSYLWNYAVMMWEMGAGL